MQTTLTPTEMAYLNAYSNRISLATIIKEVLEKEEKEALVIAEKYSFRFEEFVARSAPFSEIDAMRPIVKPLLKRYRIDNDSLTGREYLVLGLYHLVCLQERIERMERPTLSETTKQFELKKAVNEIFFHLASKKGIALADYWIARFYYHRLSINREINASEIIHFYLSKARARGITLLFERVERIIYEEKEKSDLLKTEIEKKSAETIFQLGELAYRKNQSLFYIYETLAQGLSSAAHFLARHFFRKGQRDVAVLFYKALAKNKDEVSLEELKKIIKETGGSLVQRYHACMGILHYFRDDFSFKKFTYEGYELFKHSRKHLMVTLEIRREELISLNIFPNIFEEDLQFCDLELQQWGKELLLDEENQYSLERSIRYSHKEVLEIQLNEIEEIRLSLSSQLFTLENELAEWESKKNLDTFCKEYKKYSERNFDKIFSEISKIKNDLKEIQLNRNKLFILTLKTVKDEEQNKNLPIWKRIEDYFDILKILNKYGIDFNALLPLADTEITIAGELLKWLKWLCDKNNGLRIYYLYRVPQFLRILIGDKLLRKDDLYQLMEISFSIPKYITDAAEIVQLTYDNLIKVSAQKVQLSEEKSDFDNNLHFQGLSLFINSDYRQEVLFFLQRDILKMHDIQRRELLKLVIQAKHWTAMRIIITNDLSTIDVIIPRIKNVIPEDLKTAWPEIYTTIEDAPSNFLVRILEPYLTQAYYPCVLNTTILEGYFETNRNLNWLRGILLSLCKIKDAPSHEQWIEIVTENVGILRFTSFFSEKSAKAKTAGTPELTGDYTDVLPIVSDYYCTYR